MFRICSHNYDLGSLAALALGGRSAALPHRTEVCEANFTAQAYQLRWLVSWRDYWDGRATQRRADSALLGSCRVNPSGTRLPQTS